MRIGDGQVVALAITGISSHADDAVGGSGNLQILIDFKV